MAKDDNKIMIGWTTLSSKDECIELVKGLLNRKLIACGQIDGPIDSYYNWDDKVCEDKEWRVVVKYQSSKKSEIEKALEGNHPYEVPQWVTTGVYTSKKYIAWVSNELT